MFTTTKHFPALVPVLSQITPVQIKINRKIKNPYSPHPPSYFFMIHFDIILTSVPRSSKWSLSFSELDAQQFCNRRQSFDQLKKYQLNKEDSVPDLNLFHAVRQCIKLSFNCKIKCSLG